jgi:phage terminase large subunit-like protein
VTCFDEIHAHKTHDLLNVLESAGGARKNPLRLYTTTEGYETPGPWPELRLFAHRVLDGVLEAEHFLFLIFALDDQEGQPGDPHFRPADDDFDESKWEKANPLMSVNPILAREIRKAAHDAKQMPGKHAEFKIKRLNRQSSAATTWVSIPHWKRCNGAVDLHALEGVPCWGGLDGASTRDIMAFRLLWLLDGVWFTHGWRWVPEAAVAQRTQRGAVPYAGWVAAGLIKQTPGEVIDYAIVEADILALLKRFLPKSVGYDPWNIRDLVNRLRDKLPEAVALEEFRQGTKSYHPAMQELERVYLSGNLRTGGDPVLNWCMSNIVPRFDENLNMAPDRKRSAEKIDDGVALIEAMGQALGSVEAPKPQLLFL